jgi:hypothetical protein
MSQPRTKFQVAAMYGAYYGLASILSMLLFYVLNFEIRSSLPTLIGYGLLILFMVMGTKNYRDHELGGFISYGSALGTGVLISICGGFLIAGWTVILFSFIDPEMVQRILDSTQEQMIQQGMPDAEVEKALDMARRFMTPTWLFLLSIAGSAFMGFLFSLFTSIFLKKDSNPFQSNLG